jgi:hypothetical protein
VGKRGGADAVLQPVVLRILGHAVWQSLAVLARRMRGIVPIALSLRDVAPRRAVAATATMEREAVALRVEAVLAERRLRSVLRRRRASSDERRQTLDIAVVVMVIVVIVIVIVIVIIVVVVGIVIIIVSGTVAAAEAWLLALLEKLRVARQIGLRIARTEERLLFAAALHCGRLVVAIVAHVVTRIVASVHAIAEERRRLTELFLRGGDQAKIMLGVLEKILSRNRISRRLRVAGQLLVFFGNM